MTTRRLLCTRPKLRQDLKENHSFTRWKISKEAWSLHPHKVIAQAKFSQKNTAIYYQRHIYMTRKRQYILLFHQFYNLISHRLSLFYVLGKLVMVTSRTHAIAKNSYLRGRPVWLNKAKNLRHTVPRSLSQVLGKSLRNPPQPVRQVASRVLGWTHRLDYSLSRRPEFLQLLLMVLSTICEHNKRSISTYAT